MGLKPMVSKTVDYWYSTGWARPIFWTALIIVLIVWPIALSRFWAELLTEILVFALFATSLNLLVGYSGLLSFAQGGLYGIGAYTLTLLLMKGLVPLPLAFLAAPVAAAIVGAFIGYFSVRLTALFFCLLTLAFGQLVYVIIWKWSSFTGGSDGISGIIMPALLASSYRYYIFTLLVVALCLTMLWMIVRSSFGYTLRALREDAVRGLHVGVNVRRCRLVAFVIAAFFTGISGALGALLTRGAFPECASFGQSANGVFAVILGGTNVFLGPTVGAATMLLLNYVVTKYTQYWPLAMGIILLLVVILFRGGMMGFVMERFGVKNSKEDGRA